MVCAVERDFPHMSPCVLRMGVKMEIWSLAPVGGEPGDRLRAILSAEGPCDEWLAMKDGAACAGNTLLIKACVELGSLRGHVALWFQGFHLRTSARPKAAVQYEYPSVTHNPEVAAAELDRLASLSTITRCPAGDMPPDLRVRPSQLIVKPCKVRVVRD